MGKVIYLLMVSCVIALCFSATASSLGRKTTIKAGISTPMTGDIPEVGDGSRYAAGIWARRCSSAVFFLIRALDKQKKYARRQAQANRWTSQ